MEIKHKSCIIKVLKDKRGSAYPLIPVVMLVLIMIFAAASEYMRMMIIAQGVRDAVQSAVIATVNDNYDDIYHGAREGYAGGYQPVGGAFEISIDYGDIYARLDELLGLSRSGGQHVKDLDNGVIEYALSDLVVTVQNVPLAPSDPENARKFTADATIRLMVPISFGGKSLPPMTIDLQVRAGWTELF